MQSDYWSDWGKCQHLSQPTQLYLYLTLLRKHTETSLALSVTVFVLFVCLGGMVATHGPDASDGDSGFSDVSVVSPASVVSATSMVSEASTVSTSSNTPNATPNAPGKPKISRTKPNCNKCKNHGVVNPLSGHKRYCQFRDCVCELCLLTEERRRVMAAQTRQKRAQVCSFPLPQRVSDPI